MSTRDLLFLNESFFFKVTGPLAPKPVCSFAHFSFDEQLLKAIRKSEFTQPTPIQAQVCHLLLMRRFFKIVFLLLKAIPGVLSGRDLIGIAKTGKKRKQSSK